MPTEHGGWGLTLEPGLLGLLVAPGLAGLFLAMAALLAFLLRTPLRLVLMDRSRQRRLERTELATRVVAVELVLLLVLVAATAILAADSSWWLPALVAGPLLLLALWYDLHSQRRGLVPELVGSIAIASVAAMGAVAGGAHWPLALGLWAVLSARVVTSIPHVRVQISRLHGRPISATATNIGDVTAVAVAVGAVALDRSLIVGALAVVGLVVVQRFTLSRPPRPAKVLGVRQMVLGFAVVAATTVGTWLI